MRQILISFLFANALFSTEIDSFTLRDPHMQDGLQELDSIMQGYFDLALVQANEAKSCKQELMEETLHRLLKGVFWSQFEADIENSKTLDRKTLSRENSIYRDVSLIEGIALYMANLGYVIRIGDLYIGSDKFGHFLETGYGYYHSASPEDSLEYGEMTERTYFGLMTTGVYSYGDLAANLDGYTFWRRLTKGLDAYFSCKNNSWVARRKFTWADYINAAWDEGLNCNYYTDKHVRHSVQTRIQELAMSCPVVPGHCPAMIERYRYLANRVVTEKCF